MDTCVSDRQVFPINMKIQDTWFVCIEGNYSYPVLTAFFCMKKVLILSKMGIAISSRMEDLIHPKIVFLFKDYFFDHSFINNFFKSDCAMLI